MKVFCRVGLPASSRAGRRRGCGSPGPTGMSDPSGPALKEIPVSLLPVYMDAATTCPGLPWQVLAAIGFHESRRRRRSRRSDDRQRRSAHPGTRRSTARTATPAFRSVLQRRLGARDGTHAVHPLDMATMGTTRTEPAARRDTIGGKTHGIRSIRRAAYLLRRSAVCRRSRTGDLVRTTTARTTSVGCSPRPPTTAWFRAASRRRHLMRLR